jgi:hypothetical protein
MGPRKLKGSQLSQGWVCFCKGVQQAQVPLVNAPVRGLRFTRHADDMAAVENSVEIASAGRTAEELQADHLLAQMKPGMAAHTCDQPTSLKGALRKLASSQNDGAAAQHFVHKMTTLQRGALGRP